MRTLPLEGVRVLDLSRVLAGPLCGMMLGDLGADVIKVERAGTGDETRGWGPPFDQNHESAYFLSVNRNKLSLAADFGVDADRALLRDLALSADVMLENFLPGALNRSGIDADSLLAQNPALIWCTISGFGTESMRPGYDVVVQAESGWMAITGEPDGAPVKSGMALVDVITGKDAVAGIVSALWHRDRMASSGTPLNAVQRRVHVSLEGSARAALINVAQNTLVSGVEARRWGNAHPNLVPYQLFHAADRPLVLAVGSDAQWLGLVRALALASLADDPELRTNAGRVAQRKRVVGELTTILATRGAAEWVATFGAAGVPCGVVRTVQESLYGSGATAECGIPPAVPGAIRRPPPTLNAHGALIRTEYWSAFDHVPILVPFRV